MTDEYRAPPEKIDMARANRRIQSAGMLALGLYAVAVAAGYFLLPGIINFPVELAERLAFAARTSAVVLFCLLVAVGIVSTLRRFSPEDISGAAARPPSERLAIPVAFLQNTLEQAVLAVGFYLAFATLVQGAWLSVLMVSALFFVVGRILFLRGYAAGVEGRAFGMTLTMMPVVIGYPAIFILMLIELFT